MKLNGRSNQSQRITQRRKKIFIQQEKLRHLISEIEIHGEITTKIA